MSSKPSKRPGRGVRALATALAVASALLSGCTKHSTQEGRRSGAELQPGALTSDAPLRLTGRSASLGEAAQVHAVVYNSTSGVDGSATAVSGMVLVPRKPPPPGGYRLVSYGHGAVGFDGACGPTATADLGPDDATRVAKLLEAGYAVAVSDYQGLGVAAGEKGSRAHPFREPRTSGHNLIDAARAARALLGELGKPFSGRWAAYGESQGGAAAWSAGDLASSDRSGPGQDGLELVGVAAEKPPTDFSWLVEGAAAGTLGRGDQISFLRLLRGLQVAHPDLVLDQYVRGPLAEQASQQAVFDCFASSGDKVAGVAARLGPQDTAITAQQAQRILGLLRGWQLPFGLGAGDESSPPVPFFVAASLQDEVVPVATVRAAALAESKQRRGGVRVVVKAGGPHRDFDDSDEAVSWLGDRFEGRPPPDGRSLPDERRPG